VGGGKMVRIVTKENEVELTLEDLGVTIDSSASDILEAANKYMDQTLNNYTVTKSEGNILVSPTPVWG